PNTLLAVSTGVALILMIMTASLFGEVGNTLKYVISAVVCVLGFVAFNGRLNRALKRPAPLPLINVDQPAASVLAGLFPLALILGAGAPVFFPGHDYGLMIVIAS
ncbi:hypothetical protein LTR94_032521, partial [Friedmanniomyces endolithicus]